MKPSTALLALTCTALWGCSAESGGTPPDPCATLPSLSSVHQGGCVMGLALDGPNAFWIDYDGYGSYVMGHYPDLGGPPTTLVTGYRVYHLLARNGRLYWIQAHPGEGGGYSGTDISSMSANGGPVTTLAVSAVWDEDSEIAINDTTLFVYTWAQKRLETIPLDGGPVTTLASGVDLGGISADDKYVYSLGDGNTFLRVPVGGGAPEQLPVHDVVIARPDGDYLYFVVKDTPGSRKLQRMSFVDDTIETLAEDYVEQFAFDTTRVYWLSRDIWAVPKAGGASERLSCFPSGAYPTNTNVVPPSLIAVNTTTLYTSDGYCYSSDPDLVPPYNGGPVLALAVPKP